MKLLIDAGNTRIKWCWYDGRRLPPAFRSAAYGELQARGGKLFGGSGAGADGVLVCNVAGADTEKTLRRAFLDWGLTPCFFTSKAHSCGVRNAYAKPAQLGVDRWLSMLGAWSIRRQAACIVDCGTAVTIDALDDRGNHLGGMIVPGIALMRRVLADRTHGVLPDEGMRRDATTTLLAHDTGNAVAAGTLYALVALIERVLRDMGAELGPHPLLYLSGGDLDLLGPLLDCESCREPMLIFHGMITADDKADY